jgi:hypothetical protein
MSKRTIVVAFATALLALALAGSALAFDCIRVSSSPQGLTNSTKSGNWLLFNFSTGPATQQSLANFEVSVTSAQAACISTEYAKSGQPLYFALGTGVAGGNNPDAAAGGVLAHNNPNDRVLGNGTGIDHLDDSPILGALIGAAVTCGVPVEAEG